MRLIMAFLITIGIASVGGPFVLGFVNGTEGPEQLSPTQQLIRLHKAAPAETERMIEEAILSCAPEVRQLTSVEAREFLPFLFTTLMDTEKTKDEQRAVFDDKVDRTLRVVPEADIAILGQTLLPDTNQRKFLNCVPLTVIAHAREDSGERPGTLKPVALRGSLD